MHWIVMEITLLIMEIMEKSWNCNFEFMWEPWFLSKNINPSLVLVQPRKTHPFITERLLIWRKESNQTNKMMVR